MGRQKGFTASNRYSVEKEKLVVDELLAGKSFRTIRDETGISMEAIQRIKADYKVVQPVKPKQKREKETKPREIYKARITSHVPLTHTRNGESFICNAF